MAGSIDPYETAKGRRYRVRYRKPDKSQTDKRGFKTKRDAELFLASVTVSKARGEYVDPSDGRRTLSMFSEQWKAERLALLKPSSRHAMETAWRVHVEPKWASRGVAGISESEIAAWVAEMLAAGKSAQTIRRIVFVLSGVLAIAVRERARPTNPAAGIALPKKRRKPARYLTHAQVATLAQAAGDKSLVIEFLAYTGLRWGEAVALRVRHINMLRRRISVEENAVTVKGTYEIGTPKSGLARIVPMPPHLVQELARLCEGKGPDGFLFGDGAAPLAHTHATSGWFARAVKAAQAIDATFPRITPHDLRHTAASLAVSSGANVKAVQRMLGHASAAMTLDVYADLFDDDLDAVAAAMSVARASAVS
ncbi:tyrosine-type recombinase/integrase [Microbacterium plantarum]|uniref:tyrosine-type recombinase/integrase n=1 Tax=Microbacterium plantarum TaxID=1816425 RepID=UPI002B4869E8|nr:site-specific integrase [Microbacterium plantarum]WRK16159.1 site-specific integrase [Microbacterium plantarum]